MKKAIVLIICSLSLAWVHAQTADLKDYAVTPVSPEAASLAKMVNYPVSLNTGIPDIRIPLYEIHSRGLKLPIELSYHAGGFKIHEEATRSGLGWSLSCDLQITRTIHGGCDLSPGGYISNPNINSGPYPSDQYSKHYLATYMDGQPDKFSYKLLDKSGSFYFQKSVTGSSYTIVPVPYDNLKIEYGQGVFVVTDEDGTVYHFGYPGMSAGGDYADAAHGVEYTENKDLSGNRITWKCMRIENYNHTAAIDFSYEKKPARYHRSNPDVVEYSEIDQVAYPLSSSVRKPDYLLIRNINTYERLKDSIPLYLLSSPHYFVHCGGGKSSLFAPYIDSGSSLLTKEYKADSNLSEYRDGNEVHALALASISFEGGKAVFSGADLLSSIKVLDRNNVPVQTIRFCQSRTSFPSSEVPYYFKETNYLDSIQVGATAPDFETYRFTYHDKYSFGNHLKGSDAWGYVNASTTTYDAASTANSKITLAAIEKSLEGKTFQIGSSNYDGEYPDAELMKSGILKSIIYPTGGCTVFDFEPNMIREYTSELVLRWVGGLRIKTISQYDPKFQQEAVSQKHYRYGEYEQGHGIGKRMQSMARMGPNGQMSSYWGSYFERTTLYANLDPTGGNEPSATVMARERKTIYKPFSTLDLTLSSGAPVHYTEVAEYDMDGGTQSGKTVYKFARPDKYSLEANRNYPYWGNNPYWGTDIPFINNDWFVNSSPEVVLKYRYDAGKFKLVYQKESEYAPFEKRETIKCATSYLHTDYVQIGGTYTLNTIWPLFGYTLYEYELSVGKLLLKREKEKQIIGTDTLAQETTYEYTGGGPYLFPCRIARTVDKADQEITTLKYPFDFTDPVSVEMVRGHIISPVVEKTASLNSLPVSQVKINYRKDAGSGGLIVKSSVTQSLRGGGLKEILRFDQYDPKGNVLQTTDYTGLVKSYLWGYGSRYLVAEVEGLDYSSVRALANPAIVHQPSDADELRDELAKIHQDAGQGLATTYTHQPLVGVTSKTAPDQTTVYYEYDTSGRLKAVVDTDGKVLQEYAYHANAANASGWIARQTTNPPRTESFNNPLCPPDKTSIANFTYTGGQICGVLSSLSVSEGVNQGLERMGADTNSWNSADGQPVADFARIEFRPMMHDYHEIYADFVQDETTVYTKHIRTAEPTYAGIPFYIPAGEYKVILRSLPRSHSKTTLKFYLNTPESDEGSRIYSESRIRLEAGKTYQIGVSDYY